MRWLILLLACSAQAELLKISAIDWCPQACPLRGDNPGYLVEMVKDLLEDDYELQIEYRPWSRSIHHVRTGRTDMLISPAKEEAPDLVYHRDPISYQTHCFWTLRDSKFVYRGPSSLIYTPFVIYRDHSYSQILTSVFEAVGKDHYLELTYDQYYIGRAIKLLEAGRAETFLFTVNSVIWSRFTQQKHNIKLGECIKRDELWFALTPKNYTKSIAVRKILDNRIPGYKKSPRYRELLEKYRIAFPKLYSD